MRNYTADGELKTTGGAAGTASSSVGGVLAYGVISPLTADDEGIALQQDLDITADDPDGIATAQAPTEAEPLSLEAEAEALIPPRPLMFTAAADLSVIDFEIVGEYLGAEVTETLAGPKGAAADDDGIAESQSMTEAEPLLLEAAAAELDPPRQLTFTSEDDLSGLTFEIVGTDENGDPQTVAAFAGPNNETVTTTQLWSSVTSITPSASNAGTVSVGWPDTSASVMSVNAYSSVTSITPNGTDAALLEVGWDVSTDPYPLTLTTEAASLDPPRKVTLTSAGNLSTVKFLVIGTDPSGAEYQEEVDGPAGDTVSTVSRFASVQQIVPMSLGSGSIKAGWPADSALLYRAPDTVEISHFFARNNGAQTELVGLTLVIEGEEVPWFTFELEQDESRSVLRFDPTPLPIDAGIEIRAQATDGVISYVLHGRIVG
jgi:hypothetical protein